MEIDWHGERLELLAERAAYWPRTGMLLVADLHVGKDAAFRQRGLALPAGVGASDLRRLTTILQSRPVSRLVFLGDLIHARSGITPATCDDVAEWRKRHDTLDVTLVRGNHDRAAGDPPADWRIDCVAEPYSAPPFSLCHNPSLHGSGLPTIAGHLHPAVGLAGPAGTHMTLPCFWMREGLLVLPAFTEFSGRHRIDAAHGDRIFVVGEGHVVEIDGFA